MEKDASLFASDTATPCDYNITKSLQNSDTISKGKSKFTTPMGIHLQSKHKYRNVFGDSNKQYHEFNSGDTLTFKDKYTALLQQELHVDCAYMIPTQLKVIRYLQKWTLRQCLMQCIFQAVSRLLPRLIMSHIRQN